MPPDRGCSPPPSWPGTWGRRSTCLARQFRGAGRPDVRFRERRLLPGDLAERPKPPRNTPCRVEPDANGTVLHLAGGPALLRGAEQACFGVLVHEPPRTQVDGRGGAVEIAAAVLARDEVGAGAHTQTFAQRMLVLAAAPHHHAGARGRARVLAAPERQAEDVDELGSSDCAPMLLSSAMEAPK